MIARKDAYEIVIASLNEVFAQTGAPVPASLGDESVLYGALELSRELK